MSDLTLLSQPFDRAFVKQREGRGGKKLDYLETATVIARLNEVLGPDGWSFRILERFQMEDELIVRGELRLNGVCHQQFGASKITRDRDGNIISLGDDFKAAASDTLKKTATLYGVGLELYTGPREVTPTLKVIPGNGAPKPDDPEDDQPANGDEGKINPFQERAILSLSVRKNMDREALERMLQERFSASLETLSTTQAGEVIRQLQA